MSACKALGVHRISVLLSSIKGMKYRSIIFKTLFTDFILFSIRTPPPLSLSGRYSGLTQSKVNYGSEC